MIILHKLQADREKSEDVGLRFPPWQVASKTGVGVVGVFEYVPIAPINQNSVQRSSCDITMRTGSFILTECIPASIKGN